MTWKSTSFKRVDVVVPETVAAIDEVVARHRPAMEAVVEAARRLAEDRRVALASIRDPALRASASR